MSDNILAKSDFKCGFCYELILYKTYELIFKLKYPEYDDWGCEGSSVGITPNPKSHHLFRKLISEIYEFINRYNLQYFYFRMSGASRRKLYIALLKKHLTPEYDFIVLANEVYVYKKQQLSCPSSG